MTSPTITPWRTSRRAFLGLASAATAGLALSACGTASKTGGGDKQGTGSGDKPLRSDDNLVFAGMQWGAVTNANPLSTTAPFGTTNGSIQILYETLLRFNQLDAKLEPGLGTELKQVDETTYDIPLQEGTKWQDGTDLTAEDVVFTFELGKNSAVGVSYASLWTYLESVTAKDARTVEFKLKKDAKGNINPLQLKDNVCGVVILPKAIWSKIDPSKMTTEVNAKPVGSGPYQLDKYDQTQIVYKRFDNYWGKTVFGTPQPKAIIHPIFKTNTDGDLKLASGQVDMSQQFTAEVWKMWTDQKKKVRTFLKEKPYHIPGSMPSLIFNITKPGLNNVKVRRAIAYAINYADIATKAMSSYSDTVQPSLIVPKGAEEKYFDAAAAEKTGWKQDAAAATKILEQELKATKGSDGIYKLPDGTRLGPWVLQTPTGWTDWNQSCQIIAESCKAIGIDISTNFPQAPTMQAAMQKMQFDLVHYGYSAIGPASPWTRFRDVLDSRGVAPAGQTAFWNYSRFSDPKVAELLDQAAAESDETKLKALYTQLDDIFRANIPCIPVMYRPSQFFEYNYATWTGQPTEEDPYAPPTYSGAGVRWLFKLKKVGS